MTRATSLALVLIACLLQAQNPLSVSKPEKDNTVKAELASFMVDKRLQVNLFADESMGIANPVCMRWDGRGRLWVLLFRRVALEFCLRWAFLSVRCDSLLLRARNVGERHRWRRCGDAATGLGSVCVWCCRRFGGFSAGVAAGAGRKAGFRLHLGLVQP